MGRQRRKEKEEEGHKKMHLFGKFTFVVGVKTHIHVSTMHAFIDLTMKKEISDIIRGDNNILNGEWFIIA